VDDAAGAAAEAAPLVPVSFVGFWEAVVGGMIKRMKKDKRNETKTETREL
jgi:hypothetical protein